MRFLYLILLFLISGGIFADFEYRVLVRNEEDFAIKTNAINQDNFLGFKSGLTGNAKMLFEAKFKLENLKLKFSDLVLVPLEDGSLTTNSILEANISFNLYDFYLDAGKKRILKGKGFMVSPSDFLYNYLPDYNKGRENSLQFKNGFFLAGGGYYSDFGNFSFYYIPEISIDNDDVKRLITEGQKEIYTGFYSIGFDTFDFGITCIYKEVFNFGVYGSLRISDNFVFYLDVGLTGKESNYILEKENYPYVGDIYNLKEKELKNTLQALVGLNVIMDNFGLMIEYFYNDRGLTIEEINIFKDEAKKIANDYNKNNPVSLLNLGNVANFMAKNSFPSFSRHYGMMRLYSIGIKNWEASSLCILSLSDLSGKLNNSVEYNLENINIGGSFFFSFGDDYSEFKLYGDVWGVSLYVEVCF